MIIYNTNFVDPADVDWDEELPDLIVCTCENPLPMLDGFCARCYYPIEPAPEVNGEKMLNGR